MLNKFFLTIYKEKKEKEVLKKKLFILHALASSRAATIKIMRK